MPGAHPEHALYQEGGTTGITFCHQTGGPITGWAYKRESL